MAVCFCAACYCTLHITAGLELAVDSFAVRCFKTADMEAGSISLAGRSDTRCEYATVINSEEALLLQLLHSGEFDFKMGLREVQM